jgi:transcriptional regulator with XRE-family HTH domain
MTPQEFKEARKALGLTQSQMATVLGYGAQSRISDVERGVQPVTDTVSRLIHAYLNGYRPKDWPPQS